MHTELEQNLSALEDATERRIRKTVIPSMLGFGPEFSYEVPQILLLQHTLAVLGRHHVINKLSPHTAHAFI